MTRDLEFDLLHFRYPAETEFVLMDNPPEFISSFFSTALYTVSTMFRYQSKAISIMLPLEKMALKDRDEVSTIYDSYRECMTVIDLA